MDSEAVTRARRTLEQARQTLDEAFTAYQRHTPDAANYEELQRAFSQAVQDDIDAMFALNRALMGESDEP